MAKKSNELTTTDNNAQNTDLTLLQQRPDYLIEHTETTGTELLSQYVVPPRLKIVQPLTRPPLIEMFNPGDMVALPSNTLIDSINEVGGKKPMEESPGIIVVPIFFYPEWISTNPLVGDLPFIRDRSFDSGSEIAIKSRNPKTRTEQYPGSNDPKQVIRYTEVLNYIFVLMTETDIGSEPILMSFSKSEHKAGTTLNSLVKMRKAPIFSCMFKGVIKQRSNQQGRWFGMDFANPPKDVGGWVTDKRLFDSFKLAHDSFKDAYERNLLVADYDAPNDSEMDGGSAEM